MPSPLAVLRLVAAATMFTAPILWTLLSAPKPDIGLVQFPISWNEPAAVPMPLVGSSGDARIYQMPLRAAVVSEVLRRSEIQLLLNETDHAHPNPASGRLEVAGSTCVFEMQEGSVINDARLQSFFRVAPCDVSNERPSGELLLTITMQGPGTLGLYTKTVTNPADEITGIYLMPDKSVPGQVTTLLGHFVDERPHRGLTRAHLLTYLWTRTTTAHSLWYGLGLAGLLALIGAATLPRSTAAITGLPRFAWHTAASMVLLASGLSLLYAMVVLPLQSADEPNFVLSFGELTGRETFGRETLEWIDAAHVERIRGHASETFRVRDIDAPSAQAHQFGSIPITARSSISTALWSHMAGLAGGQSVPRTFAMVRGVHAVLFGLSVAIAAAVLTLLCPVKYPQLLALPFLLVPALPSFGMQFSEAALLTGIAVLFASALVVLFIDGPRGHHAGVLLGLTTAGLLLATRSGGPMLVLVIGVCSARALIGSRSEHPRASAAIYWGGFGLGASILYALALPDQLDRFAEMLRRVTTLASPALSPLASLAARPWFFISAAAFGCLVEMVFGRLRPIVARRLTGRLATIGLRSAAAITIAVIVTSFVASLWVKYPLVEGIQGDRPATLPVHLLQVLTTMATLFRWTDHNMLMSTSFFVGFGWLDIIPTPPFESIVLTMFGGAVIAVAVRLWVSVNYRRFTWLAVFSASLVATLVTYTVSAYVINTNLHGRYLIAWFASAVAVAGSAIAMGDLSAPERSSAGSRWRIDVPILIVLVLHMFCVCVILRRYF